MKQTAILITTSLLSILFMTFHLIDDILFKMAPPGLANLFAVLIFSSSCTERWRSPNGEPDTSSFSSGRS